MDFYPEAIFIPFITTQAMNTTNVSDLDTITRTTLNPNSSQPIDVNIPQTISNLNTMAYHDYGDDTNILQRFEWVPPESGLVNKLFLNFAILCNVTARSSDDVTFESVQISIRKGDDDLIKPKNYGTGFAIQDAAGEVRMFIVADALWNNEFFVRKGSPITITIESITTGDTANITWEMGLVPFFPTTIDSNSKFFSQSGIVMHLSNARTQR